jgi:hypothetical protein
VQPDTDDGGYRPLELRGAEAREVRRVASLVNRDQTTNLAVLKLAVRRGLPLVEAEILATKGRTEDTP